MSSSVSTALHGKALCEWVNVLYHCINAQKSFCTSAKWKDKHHIKHLNTGEPDLNTESQIWKFPSFLAFLCQYKDVTQICKKFFDIMLPYHVNKTTSQDGIYQYSLLEGSNLPHTLFSKSVRFFEQLTLTSSYLKSSCIEQVEMPIGMFAWHIISYFEPLQLCQNLTICSDMSFSIWGSIHGFNILSKWDQKTKHFFKGLFLLCRIFCLKSFYAEMWSRALPEGHKCSHLTDCTASGKNDVDVALENQPLYVLAILSLRTCW